MESEKKETAVKRSLFTRLTGKLSIRSKLLIAFLIMIVLTLAVSGVVIVSDRGRCRSVTETQIERSRTGLLQFSRLFEAAMTTLLHDRAPTD